MPVDAQYRDARTVQTVPTWGNSKLAQGLNGGAGTGTAPAGAHTTLSGATIFAREIVGLHLKLAAAGIATLEFHSVDAGYFPIERITVPGSDYRLSRRIVVPAGCSLVLTCVGSTCDYMFAMLWPEPII